MIPCHLPPLVFRLVAIPESPPPANHMTPPPANHVTPPPPASHVTPPPANHMALQPARHVQPAGGHVMPQLDGQARPLASQTMATHVTLPPAR
jgi:hypothetical protein